MTDRPFAWIADSELAVLLRIADSAALEAVKSGSGGPFGAALYIVPPDGLPQPIGASQGNAVLQTGIASAHAEDRALNSGHAAHAREHLRALKGEGGLLIVSSAESCPACHAKAEIFARLMTAEGLIRPGAAMLLYGASYADTRDIAGFNDALYRDDMAAPAETRRIRIETAALPSLEPKTRDALNGGAAVRLNDGTIHPGRDRRAEHFTLTPPVDALQRACRAAGETGAAEPWNLNGATLYMAAGRTDDIGPLSYAEAQWANIARIVAVTDAAPTVAEAPDIDNRTLYNIVASRPYNPPGAALSVLRLSGFVNRAQAAWAAKLQSGGNAGLLYNGLPE